MFNAIHTLGKRSSDKLKGVCVQDFYAKGLGVM